MPVWAGIAALAGRLNVALVPGAAGSSPSSVVAFEVPQFATYQGPNTLDPFYQMIAQAVHASLKAASLSTASLAGVAVTISEPVHDASVVTSALQAALGVSCPAAVYSDMAVALSAGTRGRTQGCVVLADAGVSVFGMRGGRVAQVSGWGPAFMDGGSGFDLATRALSAIVKASEGRGADTRLQAAVLAHLSLQSLTELRKWAYSNSGMSHIAALSPLVIQTAAQGDAVADAILRHAAGELVAGVRSVASQLKYDDEDGSGEPWTVVLAGSLLSPGSLLAQIVTDALADTHPMAEVCQPNTDPAVAAAWLIAGKHVFV